jgi:hypothetical protein
VSFPVTVAISTLTISNMMRQNRESRIQNPEGKNQNSFLRCSCFRRALCLDLNTRSSRKINNTSKYVPMMTRCKHFMTCWSNVDVAESGSAGVTVPLEGELVEKEFGGLFLAACGRLCGLGWLGVFWLNLPWLPGDSFAGFSGGVVGVAVGEVAAGG